MPSSQGLRLLDVMRKRDTVIECLLNGTTEKRDIETKLGVSRQTVGRALAELEMVGVITRSRGRYEVTLHGVLAFHEYAQLTARYDTLSAAEPLLTALPTDTSLASCVLTDADIQRVDPQLPYEPFTRLADLIRASEQLKVCLPVGDTQTIELLVNQVSDGALEIELFVETNLGEKLWACYPEAMRMLLDRDECMVWQTKESLPFSLVLFETEKMWLCVHGSDGQIKGTISNYSAAAVEWASQLFCNQRDQATQLVGPVSKPFKVE